MDAKLEEAVVAKREAIRRVGNANPDWMAMMEYAPRRWRNNEEFTTDDVLTTRLIARCARRRPTTPGAAQWCRNDPRSWAGWDRIVRTERVLLANRTAAVATTDLWLCGRRGVSDTPFNCSPAASPSCGHMYFYGKQIGALGPVAGIVAQCRGGSSHQRGPLGHPAGQLRDAGNPRANLWIGIRNDLHAHLHRPPALATASFGQAPRATSRRGKLDYEGSVAARAQSVWASDGARQLNTKRQMPDGSMRDSDNWQKLGIPLDA